MNGVVVFAIALSAVAVVLEVNCLPTGKRRKMFFFFNEYFFSFVRLERACFLVFLKRILGLICLSNKLVFIFPKVQKKTMMRKTFTRQREEIIRTFKKVSVAVLSSEI